MTPDQVLALGAAFAAFVRTFEGCVAYRPTARHLHAYCRGLLSDLPRKSVEPLALACGTAVRTLQEFLRDHVWDHLGLRDRLQRRLAGQPALRAPDPLGTIGVLDETSTPKKGTKTPGVARQYCGASGKVDNCVVTVHLAVVRGLFKTLVDAALFLPKAWNADRARCRAAGIPDDVAYRPKWRIALEQVARAAAHGLKLDWLTFAEYYGGKPAFLKELDDQEQWYVGEVPRNCRCLARRPRGRRPQGGWRGQRADDVARYSPAWNRQAWRQVALARVTLADQVWQVRAGPVHLVRNRGNRRQRELTDRTYWLLVARNPATGQAKYFVSNAPATTPVETLLRVAFCRWHVEHAFRVAKSEIGFSHFEGRSYVALLRHQLLCLLVLGFVAEHTERLQGEKTGADAGAGVPRPERALPRVAGAPPRHHGPGVHRRGHRLPPAAQPSGPRRAAKAARPALNLAL